jgi:hypothetical protein
MKMPKMNQVLQLLKRLRSREDSNSQSPEFDGGTEIWRVAITPLDQLLQCAYLNT